MGIDLMLKSFMKIFTKDQDLMRLQSNVAAAIEQVIRREILDYVIIDATVTATATSFNHGLGRLPVGWIVIDKDAIADIWSTDKDARTITLQASLTANTKLLIF